MILAMNIGTTNFMLGLKKNGRINTTRYPSRLFKSRDDFARVIGQSIDAENIGAVLSSVNPGLTGCLEGAVKELFSITALTVNPSMNMKLDLSRYDTALIGSDRICVCEAALSQYSPPIIVFDFGTATTINVIDKDGCFAGGSILPGLTMGINALAKDTAQLPQGKLSSRSVLLGRNTQECIISGAVFGNAAMLDGMTARIEELLGQKAAIIVTGGSADYVLPACSTKAIHNPDLLMEGLYILYDANISR